MVDFRFALISVNAIKQTFSFENYCYPGSHCLTLLYEYIKFGIVFWILRILLQQVSLTTRYFLGFKSVGPCVDRMSFIFASAFVSVFSYKLRTGTGPLKAIDFYSPSAL